MTFTAVYVKDGKWIVAYVPEVPGAHTQGRTLKEARSNLREALRLVLAANRKLTRLDAKRVALHKDRYRLTLG